MLLRMVVPIILCGAMVSVAIAQDSVVELEFEYLHYGMVVLPGGEYVFRDLASWNEAVLPHWPVAYRLVDGEYELVPPPEPSFENHLIVAVSYGMSGCHAIGGNLKSAVLTGDEVVFNLAHVYGLMTRCLAEMPRVFFYAFAKDDIPDDAEITFNHAAEPYDLDPQRWYPLADGNTWHFIGYFEWVRTVDGSITRDDESWHRIRTIYCDEDPCPQPETQYLRWSDDHYLLEWNQSSDQVDTLHASSPRSIFTVDVRRDTTLSRDGHKLEIGIGARAEMPFGRELVLFEYGDPDGYAYYGYGVGPVDFRVAAVIDGEHIGDTSLIARALSTESTYQLKGVSRIDVAPHPAGQESVITIRTETVGRLQLHLFDLTGRTVFESSFDATPGAEWRLPLRDAGTLASGLYLVRVTDSSGTVADRAIVVVD